MKYDPAHIATDAEIAKVEKLIAKEFKKAHKEASKKLDDYLAAFATKDEKWQEWVAAGTKTKKEYNEWRKGQVLIGKRWQELRDSLADDYTNAAKIANSICKEHAPEVYALNHNYATFQVEKGALVDTSYTLFSRESVERMYRENPKLYHTYGKAVAKDIKAGKQHAWDKRRIQSVLMQGIIQGESIPNLTKRLEHVTGGDHKAAIRNARTMMTGVQNAGRIDAYDRAKNLGIPVRKQWLATLDARTRHWHRELDGAIVDNDEPFENEFGKIMFPGDPEAAPANIYNCRCTLLAAIEGFEIDVTDTSLRSDKNLAGMTYGEWLKSKKSISNPIDLPEKKAAAIKGAWYAQYGKGGKIANPVHKHTAAEGQKLIDDYDAEQQAKLQAQLDKLGAKEYSDIWQGKVVTPADYADMDTPIKVKHYYLDNKIKDATAKGDSKALAKYNAQKKSLLDFEKQGKKYQELDLKLHPEKAAKIQAKPAKVSKTAKAAQKANKPAPAAPTQSTPKPAKPAAKKLTEKEAQDAVTAAIKELDDFDGAEWHNIWKDPVTPADYAAKKDKIKLKKQYFEDQLDIATTPGKKAHFESLLYDLKEFEEMGKEYEAAKAKLEAAKKALEPFEQAKKVKAKAKLDAAKNELEALEKKKYDLSFIGLGVQELDDDAIKHLKKFKAKSALKAYASDPKFQRHLQKIEQIENDLKERKKLEKKIAKLEGKVPGGGSSGTFAPEAYLPDRKSKAKNYSNRGEADKFWRPELDKQWKSLTDQEKYSVWSYTSNSNPLNKPLSGYADGAPHWDRAYFKGVGKVPWSTEDNWRRLYSDDFIRRFAKDSMGHVDHKKVIQNLTRAIEKAPLKEDAWFVRGSGYSGLAGWMEGAEFSFDEAMRLLQRGDTASLRAMLQGKQITNHAYTSTGIARGSGFGGEVSYRIYAPKGTKAIYAEPTSYYGDTVGAQELLYTAGQSYRSVGGEAEMIFQRGTTFRIVDIKKVGGRIEVELEVVDQPGYFKTGLEETITGGKTSHKF